MNSEIVALLGNKVERVASFFPNCRPVFFIADQSSLKFASAQGAKKFSLPFCKLYASFIIIVIYWKCNMVMDGASFSLYSGALVKKHKLELDYQKSLSKHVGTYSDRYAYIHAAS